MGRVGSSSISIRDSAPIVALPVLATVSSLVTLLALLWVLLRLIPSVARLRALLSVALSSPGHLALSLHMLVSGLLVLTVPVLMLYLPLTARLLSLVA